MRSDTGCCSSSGRRRQKRGSVGRGLSFGELAAGPGCVVQTVRAIEAPGTQPWGPLGPQAFRERGCGVERGEQS